MHANTKFAYGMSNIQGSEVYSEKSGGHPLIYPKGQTVELVSSNITLSALERFPPWNSSVIDSLPCFQCAIEQCPNNHCYRWRG